MGFLSRLWAWLHPTPTPPVPPTPPPADMLQGLVDAHNRARAADGTPRLSRSRGLDRAAQKWAEAMAASGRMTHGAFATRIDAEGVVYSAAGENIAYGYDSVAAVMAGWLSSRGHRANIMNGTFDAIGVGVAATPDGTRYWCVDFCRLSTTRLSMAVVQFFHAGSADNRMQSVTTERPA